jgi:drug/metabolite transporter (DMT)-like permease
MRRSSSPAPSSLTTPSVAMGYAAMALTVAVWAGFALTLRGVASSRLQVADVALLRFGVPTLLLLPLLPSRWSRLRSVRPSVAGMLLAGAGVPFFFTAAAGGALTSAAAVGTLVPGLVPAFSALGRRARRGGSRDGSARGTALTALVLAGVAVMVLPDLLAENGGAMAGAALLLVASALWALYTTGLARIDLDPVGCALLLCLPSTAVVAVLIAVGALPSALGTVTLQDVLPFLIVQGLGVGLLAALTYPVAVQGLGPRRAALLGTVSPVIVALLGVPLLGEDLGPATVGGVLLISAAVVLGQLAPPPLVRVQEGTSRA